jgi:hypothetical protein
MTAQLRASGEFEVDEVRRFGFALDASFAKPQIDGGLLGLGASAGSPAFEVSDEVRLGRRQILISTMRPPLCRGYLGIRRLTLLCDGYQNSLLL